MSHRTWYLDDLRKSPDPLSGAGATVAGRQWRRGPTCGAQCGRHAIPHDRGDAVSGAVISARPVFRVLASALSCILVIHDIVWRLFAVSHHFRHFAVEPQADGSYFIDRSSKWFSVILDYLRTRKLSLDIYDLKRAERIEFQTEVEFYGLGSLLDLFQGVLICSARFHVLFI